MWEDLEHQIRRLTNWKRVIFLGLAEPSEKLDFWDVQVWVCIRNHKGWHSLSPEVHG